MPEKLCGHKCQRLGNVSVCNPYSESFVGRIPGCPAGGRWSAVSAHAWERMSTVSTKRTAGERMSERWRAELREGVRNITATFPELMLCFKMHHARKYPGKKRNFLLLLTATRLQASCGCYYSNFVRMWMSPTWQALCGLAVGVFRLIYEAFVNDSSTLFLAQECSDTLGQLSFFWFDVWAKQ